MVNPVRIAILAMLLHAATTSAQPAETAVLRGESPQTRKRLAEAEQKILDGKNAEAVEDLQRILDESSDDLVSVDGRQHRSARSVVHQILAKLPPEALKSYQNRIDEPAKKLLDTAKRDRDLKPLRQLLDRYFVSRPSEEGLLLLGDLLYERGEFRLAEHSWRRLLPEADEESRYPGAKPDAASLRARIVLAVHMQGDAEHTRAELAAFAKLHPDANGPLAGKNGPYVQTLREWIAKPNSAAAASNRTWPQFGGDASRSGTLAGGIPLRWPTRPTWSASLPPPEPIAFPQKSPPARPPFGHPVIADGWVYATDGMRVLGYELATSTMRIVYPPAPTKSELRATDPPSCATLTAAHGRLYVRTGLPVVRVGEAAKTASAIVCLDPHAKASARFLWRLKPPSIEGRAAAVWEGSPLVAEGRLWAAYSRIEGGRIVFAIACYDPADSDDEPDRPLWTAEVCESPLPTGSDQSRGRLELLTLAGGHIVFNTNAGAVIALDAATGRRTWAFQYPRAAKKTDANRSWESAPAVASGGRIFIAPADGDRVFALDSDSGRELWQSGPVEGASILGVVRNRVILSTTGLVKGLRGLNVATGSYRQPEGWLQTAGLGYGQGFVCDSSIVWPSREGVYFLDPESGLPIRNKPPLQLMNADDRGQFFGNLTYADGWLVGVGAAELRAYRPLEKPYLRPDDPRNTFASLMDQGMYLDAARGDFPKPLRAAAAAKLTDGTIFPDLRDEWILTANGELLTYGHWLDRRAGKPEPECSAPGKPWSAADRAVLDAPSITADVEISRTVKLPPGATPLRPLHGAKPPLAIHVAKGGELLAIRVEDGSQKSFAIAESFTHAADLADGFVLAGPFAVAVYGAGREPVWVFRMPDLDSLPPPELSSFHLAGAWLFARLGERHVIALDLQARVVAWVLGTHGGTRFEPLAFHSAPGFTPQFLVTERAVVVQLTDGRRWLVQATTGKVKTESQTATAPWAAPPVELDGVIAFPDGPGLVRLANGMSKLKAEYQAEGESSFAGEPPQVRRIGEMLFVAIRRNYGLELLRLDPSTGKPEWSEPAFLETGSLDLSAADADPQRLLVPVGDTLFALDLEDGSVAWKVRLPGATRWKVRAGRTAAIATPAEAIPEEPFDAACSRIGRSFLRDPQPWRLPCLAAALYDCWTDRAAPVILLDLESGKRLKTLTIPARGPCVQTVFEGDTAVVATSDRIAWLK
jgi:outer membrane protein assembly factor BamB